LIAPRFPDAGEVAVVGTEGACFDSVDEGAVPSSDGGGCSAMFLFPPLLLYVLLPPPLVLPLFQSGGAGGRGEEHGKE